MKSTRRDKSIVDMLFLLALFGVFVISALFIVLFGANIYKKTVNDMDANFSARTSVSYITEKIRTNDTDGNVFVLHRNEQDTLALRRITDYGTYYTYLYYSDGYLREITVADNATFAPETGTPILEATSFGIEEIGPSLLAFHITDDKNAKTTFYVSINTTGGIAHE